MNTEVFIVGKFIGINESGTIWEFQGVFSSAEKADIACISSDYFYGPATLDRNIPDERVEWIDCVYPRCGN